MRMRNGMAVLRESWAVLKQDPEMMWFPVLSFFGMLAVVATVVGIGFVAPDISTWAFSTLVSLDAIEFASLTDVAILFAVCYVIYFVEYFVVIYFNTALIACAMLRFEGGDPTVSYGLQMANERIVQILGWTAFASSVGALLSTLEQRLGFLGQLVVKLVGLAWSIATYFVVPVLVVEQLGPIKSFKRSVELLKETWGEGLTGNFALGVFTVIAVMASLAIGGALTALGIYADQMMISVTGVAIAIVLVIGIIVFSSTLNQIFLAGLYQFASTKTIPSGYSQETLQNAITKK